MRQLARWLLLLFSSLIKMAPVRRGIEAAEMFASAMVGRGGGSSWDHAGQTRALAELIAKRDGLTVFDVGANNGAWATELHGKIKGNAPHYVLFECAPYCFEGLEQRAPALGNARIEKVAVSDAPGEIDLHVTDVGSGLASVHERADTSIVDHTFSTITVPAVTIDGYAAEHGVDAIDVLKIDVEGHEMAVLKGAEESFSAGKVRLVMFEFGSANVNSRTFFKDFWNFFTDHGFALFRVAPGGVRIHVTAYDDRMEYFRGATNYLALRAGS